MNRPASPDDDRIHTEAPAEGDSAREFPEIRSHSQDPAEGPDVVGGDDDAGGGTSGPPGQTPA